MYKCIHIYNVYMYNITNSRTCIFQYTYMIVHVHVCMHLYGILWNSIVIHCLGTRMLSMSHVNTPVHLYMYVTYIYTVCTYTPSFPRS